MPTSDSNNSTETDSLIAAFKMPSISDNSDGWGPCLETEQFKDLPYQKFSKSDRIGKIADWSGATHIDKKNVNKYQPQFSVGNVGQYSYFHDEDENQYTLVDTTKATKSIYQRKTRQLQNKNKGKMQYPGKGPVQKQNKLQKLPDNKNKQFANKKRYPNARDGKRTHKEPSTPVKDNWNMIEEIDFSRLTKLNLPLAGAPEDLKICGSLEYYDKSYDRLNTKSAKKLMRINRVYHTVTTVDDPVIRELSKTNGNVFATDSIIATLMCCGRSVNPWDIVVSKVKNKLFFDARNLSEFDLLSVSETSTDPPQDDGINHINSPQNLALEATFINHNFSQQVLLMNKERYEFEYPNPFIAEGEETEVASVAYRYRKWSLGDGIDLIIRSELDAAAVGPNGETQFVTLKALNEWDPRYSNGMDWRSKLDSQPGAVLASEIKNNGFKLAKWAVSSLLSGADQLKFGFVSRSMVRATDKHVILMTQQFKPYDFAVQIALNMDNAWGIVRCIIDFLMKQDDGKYIIMKDPNKGLIRIYSIPDDEFSDSEQEGGDDEEENEGN